MILSYQDQYARLQSLGFFYFLFLKILSIFGLSSAGLRYWARIRMLHNWGAQISGQYGHRGRKPMSMQSNSAYTVGTIIKNETTNKTKRKKETKRLWITPNEAKVNSSNPHSFFPCVDARARKHESAICTLLLSFPSHLEVVFKSRSRLACKTCIRSCQENSLGNHLLSILFLYIFRPNPKFFNMV